MPQRTRSLLSPDRLTWILGLLAVLAPMAAFGQTPDYAPDAKEIDGDLAVEDTDGWETALELGFNASVADSSSVVGATDGTTVQLGLTLKGGAILQVGQHEWLTSLAISLTQTRTPTVPVFVKSTDLTELKSAYLYSIESVPWLGPFARFRLTTQLFQGDLARAARVRLVGVPEADTFQEPVDGEPWRFKLTSAFEPLVLRESAGAFARPFKSDTFSLTMSLGAGAQQVRTSGGYAVTDDPATSAAADDPETPEDEAVTDTIELSPLADSTQVGAELEVEVTGKFTDRVAYSATANVLYPFYSDPEVAVDGKALEGLDLTNVDLTAKVSFKLAKWASVDYLFSAKLQPLVIDEWQVRNSLLLNAAFNIL